MDVDGARLAVVRAASEPLQELAPREHDTGARRKQNEHLELDERELYRLTANVDRPAWQIDSELAPLDHLDAIAADVRRGGAAQQRPYTAAKLPDRERLRDVVVGAELQTEHLVELLALAR